MYVLQGDDMMMKVQQKRKKYAHFTDHEKQIMRIMREEGSHEREIAEEIGCHVTSVRKFFRGYTKRPTEYQRKPRQKTSDRWAGKVACLRCGKMFWSWDRRHNRLCSKCVERNGHIML